MKLRYAGNVLPFEDGMKKVAAITWSSSGKKLAVGAADRVTLHLFSLSTSLIKTDRGKTSFPPNPQTRDKRAILSEVSNSPQIHKKLPLHKVTTLFSSTKSVSIGDKRKPSATNSQ